MSGVVVFVDFYYLCGIMRLEKMLRKGALPKVSRIGKISGERNISQIVIPLVGGKG